MYFRHYSIISSQNVVSGLISARDESEARSKLRQKRLEPIVVQRFYFFPRIIRSVKHLDILFFLKNLSLFLKSGMTLGDALEESSRLIKSSALKRVVIQVSHEVSSGNSLTNALQNFHSVFSLATVNLLRIGEESGNLQEIVDRISVQEDQMFELRKKIKAAAAYPIIIVSITLVLLIFFFILILPRFNTLFLSIGSDVPPSVAAFMAIGRFFTDYGWLSALYLFVGLYGIAVLLRFPIVARLWQLFLLRLPIVSTLIQSYNLALIDRMLSTLMNSGIDAVKALQISAESINNTVYARSLVVMSIHTSSGQSLTSSLEKFPHLYPSLTLRVVNAGEKSGSLGLGLDYLAQFYLRELDYSTRTLTTIIEPVLLLIVGIVIGGLALSIITPIYEFVSTVGQ